MISASIPNDIRRGIYRRDGYACALCGDPRHLNVHHVYPRGEGGGNSPCNLITLCRVCHAAAHGTKLEPEYPFNADDVEQAAVEYVADMYAPGWCPFDELDYGNPDDKAIAVQMIADGIAYTGKGVW